MSKRYSRVIQFSEFVDRFNYLKLFSSVGVDTFGSHRYLNQVLYRSPEWRRVRREIIMRDDGCDLAHPGLPIFGNVFIHHLNPINVEDVLERRPIVFDPENLICCSFKTHNALHYGTEEDIMEKELIIRTKNDTCPWK